jgi:hypothetical protein
MKLFVLFSVLNLNLAYYSVFAHSPPHKISLVNVANVRMELNSGYSINVSPNEGLIDGSYVAVSYSSSSPSSSDLVLAYAPLPANLSNNAPVEWFFPSEVDPSYLSTGVGALPARLINMRSPYTFIFATGGLENLTAVAVSKSIEFANYNEPRAARLAVTGVTSEMRISWSSMSTELNPGVEIEEAISGQGKRYIPATSSITWSVDDMCGPPATTIGFRDPGYVHSVVVTDLLQGEGYSYTVGDNSTRSQPYTFTQPSLSYPFSISVVGDMGSNSIDGSNVFEAFPPAPNTTRLIASDVASGLSHAVFHVGDISYARGYQSSWEFFLDSIAGINVIAPRVPYQINQGNHEVDSPDSWPSNEPVWASGSDSGGECAVPTANLFAMPGALGNASKLWWSSTVGPFFTVQFSSELDSSQGSEMYTFIKDALASVDRRITPWVIVAAHRPFAISSTNDAPGGGDTTVAAILRNNIAPLFADVDGSPVDIVFGGHHHSYQRLAGLTGYGPAPGGAGNLTIAVPCPTGEGVAIYKGGIAPIYLDIGTGGAGFSTNIITPQPDWACVVSFWHGFARMTAVNASALHWQFINDINGEVGDEAWIMK